uniref:EGF-like domain-containing protein n=1 Tax=Ditylenchus dipsaci TaxID=166011 RepID=A0A915DY25_9BILA
MESLQHLLILCCYGGAPYIDYLPSNSDSALTTAIRHESTRMVDPTDWIAVDSTGSLLNSTIHPEILAANPHLADLIPRDSQVLLEQCDLYNLTFSSLADEHLFEVAHGKLNCRCPKGRAGRSCELSTYSSSWFRESSQIVDLLNNMNSTADSEMLMPSVAQPITYSHPNSFAIYLVLFLLFMVAMAGVFMMMRGCLCDCFGGFKNPFSSTERYNRPIDPNALNRCLESVKAHEQNEKNKYMIESRRPLISSVSENCPYNPTPQPSIFPSQMGTVESNPRSHSPPPSYRSLNASLEFLPTPTTNTKL